MTYSISRPWTSKMLRRADSRELLSGLLLVAALVTGYAIYSAAFHGQFHFDDEHSFAGLSHVRDAKSAIEYIFSNDTGPLGRPVAMASFLLNAPSWPDSPRDFLFTNTLIHLLNVVLVVWLALRVCRVLKPRIEIPPTVPVLIGGAWGLHPLLASASLMPVQRMTTLPSTFVLLGLLGYVMGRMSVNERPSRAYTVMTASLLLGTSAAVLTKEIGILLPLYAGVLESTLLTPLAPVEKRSFRLWLSLTLGVPTLALLGYMVTQVPVYAAGYSHRSFGLLERIATEPVILWEYARLIAAPMALALGPFHDDYQPLSLLDPTAVLALGGWIVLGSVALLLRARVPLLTFSVAWFLVGHLLESTIVGLELYFEHRNYLPSLGPIALIVFGMCALGGLARQKGRMFASIYIVALGAVLYQVTSLWGQPLLGAGVWVDVHPVSSRAAQFLSRQLSTAGRYEEAREVLVAALEREPRAGDLALQVLQTHCGVISRQEFQDKVSVTGNVLKTAHYSSAAVEAMIKLVDAYVEGKCIHISASHLVTLGEALLLNPRYEKSQVRYVLHRELARVYFYERDLDGTMRHLELAYDVQPDAQTAVIRAGVLASAGLKDEALDVLARSRRVGPLVGTRDEEWNSLLDKAKAGLTGEAVR